MDSKGEAAKNIGEENRHDQLQEGNENEASTLPAPPVMNKDNEL